MKNKEKRINEGLRLKRPDWNKVISTFKQSFILGNLTMKDIVDFFACFAKYGKVSIVEILDAFNLGESKLYEKYSHLNGSRKKIVNIRNVIDLLNKKSTYQDAIDALINLSDELDEFIKSKEDLSFQYNNKTKRIISY